MSPEKIVIPEPAHRAPSTGKPDPREPNNNALKGGAVDVNRNRAPITVTHNESEREAHERANRGRFRRIF